MSNQTLGWRTCASCHCKKGKLACSTAAILNRFTDPNTWVSVHLPPASTPSLAINERDGNTSGKETTAVFSFHVWEGRGEARPRSREPAQSDGEAHLHPALRDGTGSWRCTRQTTQKQTGEPSCGLGIQLVAAQSQNIAPRHPTCWTLHPVSTS